MISSMLRDIISAERSMALATLSPRWLQAAAAAAADTADRQYTA
jgi:hypothetical protein